MIISSPQKRGKEREKMKCPNCNETSRIREKDNFCHRCGCNLKTGETEQKWKGAILSVDEEVQGNREIVSDLNELKDKVNGLLDKNVKEVIVKKTRATNSSSCNRTY